MTNKNILPATGDVLRNNGFYYLTGTFNDDMAEKIVTWILEMNMIPSVPFKNLTLIINSHGGSTVAAFAIVDAMRGSKLPVHTIGLGQIASSGLITFMAGTKGHRTLTPNTSILSHQFAWANYGKQHELIATTKEISITEKRILTHYKKCTGLTEKVIIEKLLPAHDVWLTAEEAVKYKLADNIKDMK